jgi:hypothetical protein
MGTFGLIFGKGRPPWALALPFNSQDIGTSCWQLMIERYTNF